MYKRGQNNDNGILHSAVSIANSRGVLILVAPHDSREGGRGGEMMFPMTFGLAA